MPPTKVEQVEESGAPDPSADGGLPPGNVQQPEVDVPAATGASDSAPAVPLAWSEMESYAGTLRHIDRFPRDDLERQVNWRETDAAACWERCSTSRYERVIVRARTRKHVCA